MYVREVEIQNIKGIEFLRFEPGTVTILAGANGSGKSSVIDAIRMIFDGGSDPGWLRNGAKKGYCKLGLDNGAAIVKHVTSKGSRLEITDEDGNPVGAPQSYINSLAEALAVDPAKLLDPRLKAKDIATVLLEVMPIRFSLEEFTAACGDCPNEMNLAGLDSLRKTLYERRRKVNAEAETASRTVTGLSRDLGVDDKTDWRGAQASAKETLAAAEADLLNVRRQLEATAAEQIEAIREKLKGDLSKVTATAEPHLDASKRDLAIAESKVGEQAKREGARATIEKMRVAAREKASEGDDLTAKIDRLDDLKRRKLADLPIDGLAFDGEEFNLDGVPWEHVNQARKTDVALQVAVLKSGAVRMMVLDNAEHLDAEGMNLLEEGAVRRGFQVVAARVSDKGDLQVQAVA